MVRKSRSLKKRLLPAIGLALIASLVLSGLAAGSASAAGQQWYRCSNEGGSGPYTDSACQTPGSGSYDWIKLPELEAEFNLKGTAPFTISGTVALTHVLVSCSGAHAGGWLKNPAGSPGTLETEAWGTLVLSGCTVVEPSPCSLKEETITFKTLKGVAPESEGTHTLTLTPTEGTTYASFKFGSCSKAALVGATGTLSGSIAAIVNPANSSFEFTEASSSPKLSGAKAVFQGTAKIEDALEEGLRLGVPAPVNTAAPTLSPSSPNVGTTLTAGKGSWAHEPTTYAYQWKRCSIGGTECHNVGENKSTYTAAAADESHTLKVEVTASNAGGSMSAASVTSGIVGPQPGGTYHWYSCQTVEEGEGPYEDSACSKEGEVKKGMTHKWVQLAAGTPTSFTSKNTTPVSLTFIDAGVTLNIGCTTESGSGTILNPTGGGAGTLSGANTLLALSGCEFTTPSTCHVKGKVITSSAVAGKDAESNVALSGEGAGSLFAFTIEGCPSFAGSYQISGTLNGTMTNAYSTLEFTSTSGSELKFGGLKTWIEGKFQITSAGGGAVKLAQ
jgi:hypothetical protein